MSAIKRSKGIRRPDIPQSGVAAVEFALLATLFFVFVFGIIEVSRLLYVYNTLQEVTRRAAAAAAHVSPNDTAGIDRLKQNAIFRDSPGELPLASPITDANVRLEYLALTRDNTGKLSFSKIDTGSLPSCAAQNRAVCMGNPNAANCIRFVRASICDTSDTVQCKPVHSRMIVPLVDLPVALHKATTIATVESLGYTPGAAPCADPAPFSP